MLKDLVRKIALQEGVPPEHATTTLIQQPRTFARVGTRFSSDSGPASKASTGVLAAQNELLRPPGQMAPQANVSTSANGSQGSGGSGGMSGGSGGMSGGGY